jgi:hypothetical protein
VSEERPELPSYDPTTDSARFLQAGAVRSFWVRSRVGNLAAAMPRIRKEIAAAENCVIESNSILGFLKPDLYLSVLDAATADFKESARLFLDRADAILLRSDHAGLEPQWRGVSGKLYQGKPHFMIQAPEFMTDEVAMLVERKLAQVTRTAAEIPQPSSIHRAV